MKKTLLTLISSLLISSTAFAADPIQIVTSFSILEDMVKQVGGNHVVVNSLVSVDGDAHSFQPSAQDALKLTKAKIIFINGLGFEPWAKKLITSSGTKAKVVVASKNITPLKMQHEEGHGAHNHKNETDPHAWNDLKNGIQYVKLIQAELTQIDPENEKDYATNANTYVAELEKMNEQAQNAFAKVPLIKRNIVMSHDSMGYFAKAFGLTIHSAQGLSTEIEPTAKEVAALIDDIRKEKISAIFLDSIANPKLLERISIEVGVKIGGKLYSDALSAQNSPASSYKSLYEHNINTVLKVLQ